MIPKILLVNPPIYDFTAYDFWLKPFGMLSAAGKIRDFSQFFLFDFLDRTALNNADSWGRGSFRSKIIEKPSQFAKIPRKYRRFGTERAAFQAFLAQNGPFDIVMIQTSMTYWYQGIREVIDDVRNALSDATVVLGGTYATLCPAHAAGLGADIVICGSDLKQLYELVKAEKSPCQTPLWEAYGKLDVGIMKLSCGCPYSCTYCAGGLIDGEFAHRQLSDCIADLHFLIKKNVKNIAFYDDALLFKPEKVLFPFLEYVISNDIKVNFHTPNAFHARFVTAETAKIMVRAGFKTFYLGFESKSAAFQAATGSKVVSDDLAIAAENLLACGAEKNNIVTYQILGHPHCDLQELEESMRFAGSLGLSVMLADFSPIPSTPDGEFCRKFVDLDEPLNHNKTAFPVTLLGTEKVNYFKALCKKINANVRN